MYQILNGPWNIPEIISEKRFVILQFGTNTCTPCKAIANKLEDWSQNHRNMFIEYIPVETYLSESTQMGILSSPTLLFYIDGKLSLNESGYFSLEDFLNKIIQQMNIAE